MDTKDFCYIIMHLCIINLEDYIKSRENKIAINEIKEVLILLNNAFKIMNEKK